MASLLGRRAKGLTSVLRAPARVSQSTAATASRMKTFEIYRSAAPSRARKSTRWT